MDSEAHRELKWIGTALQIGGALALSSAAVSPPVCYLTMLGGSLTWLSVGVLNRDPPLALLNAAFSLINVFGLVRWST